MYIDWFSTAQNIIFTRLSVLLQDAFLEKYPKLNITNSSRDGSKPQFPTVYFQSLESPESGNTLENYEMNGVEYAVQIKVIAEEEYVAKEISNYAKLLMKNMMFNVVASPLSADTPDTFVMVARYRRTLSKNDVI